MYKYSCRDCRIRERCIDQNDSAVHVKTMIRTAFAARTDTLAMWGILQKKCLLIQEDEERERKAQEESILSRRLREVRTAKAPTDEASTEEVKPTAGQTASISADAPSAGSASLAGSASGETGSIISDPSPNVETPPRKTDRIAFEAESRSQSLETAQLEPEAGPKTAPLCWLVLNESGRRISLPPTGTLTLGRFDPDLAESLDVDLTYEDQVGLSVSRRHAQIKGMAGHHTIEDLDSSNGVQLNGETISPGRICPLQPGDLIILGKLQLRYETMPADFLSTLRARVASVRHYLVVTHTGRKVEMAPPDSLIIGRADPNANLVVGVDLSCEGDVAFRVSRRHARISWSNQLPYLQDLNSSFGTRLNGERLLPGQSVLLKPGDHLSLGGCVLAYDVEL